MPSEERCPRCDRLIATDDDYARSDDGTHDYDGHGDCWCQSLCWGGDDCTESAVDWRARALEAERALEDGRDRLQTIVDEELEIEPVLPLDDLLSIVEQGLFARRLRLNQSSSWARLWKRKAAELRRQLVGAEAVTDFENIGRNLAMAVAKARGKRIAELEAAVKRLRGDLSRLRPQLPPARMDAPEGPVCGCGRPSALECGLCVDCARLSDAAVPLMEGEVGTVQFPALPGDSAADDIVSRLTRRRMGCTCPGAEPAPGCPVHGGETGGEG